LAETPLTVLSYFGLSVQWGNKEMTMPSEDEVRKASEQFYAALTCMAASPGAVNK
jgi:hypothetical protein